MIRKALFASVVLGISFGVATAEEFFGAIKKVEDGKIAFVTRKKGEKGEEKTFSLAKSVKVVKAKFNKEEKKVEAGEELEGGLKNKRFEEIGKFGVGAQIITNGDGVVTEIRVFEFKKKKNDA